MCARILVIDDDPVNLDLMIYLLKAFGHTPIPADGAAAGLQNLRASPVDLILCDIQMPGMDGYEFLRQLDAERLRNVPVVGVTALAMVGDREKVLAAGFDGYMAKPIAPETFVQEIERFVPAVQRAEPNWSRNSEEAMAAVAPPARERNHLRVLVADDEPANLEILRLLLQYEGYDVLTATTGDAALEIALRERPHVVVSDVHMPGGGGFGLIERMRKDPRLRATPVIFVSATSPRRKDVAKGMTLGASKFLLSPFEPVVLLRALSECLTTAGGGET
jgi:two-component system, cell cycle response regulator